MATQHAALAKWENDLLPNIVDRLAEVTPTKAFAEYPVSPTSYDDGYRVVTYRDLGNVVDGLAWWLRDRLAPPDDSDEPQVLAYIGPNDLRYPALVLAAAKAGYVIFLTSPRNSLHAHGRLFETLNCKVLLSPGSKTPLVESLIQEHGMQHIAIPSVAELLDTRYSRFEYAKNYGTAFSEPLVVVHTSGSTGVPKPLIWTHETFMRMVRMMAMAPPLGYTSLDRMHQGKRVLCTFPPFHGAGLKSYLMNAIPFGTVIIAPVAEGIVTAENLVKAVQKTKVDIGLFVPSLVLELSQNPELLDTCATQLELMLFCGGDLPQAIGDIVAQKIPLWCQYGASEIGLTPQLLDPRMVRSDWHCIKLHPCLGIEFRHVTEDLYELYVKRDAAKVETQPTFTELPDLHRLIEYGSRDLFSQHPFIPNVWKWRARADDIIVFLNGEKTNPTSMEQSVVATNAEVSGALVVGAQRFQAALLIEPVGKSGSLTTEEQAELIERIWPSIEEANALTPAHARIEKGLVLLTSPEKPMIRAGKGTIQRQATLAAYSDEIDQLYARMDVHAGAPVEDSQMPSDLINPEKVNAVVADSLKAVLQGKRFQDHENLFVLGMDSLQSLQVLRRLKKALPLPELALSTIYSNPSVSELTRAIMSSAERVTASREAAMERLLNSLQERIAQIALPTRPTDVPSAQVVILTGSTGSLGTHLLRALIGNDSVRQIFCLNRRLDTMSDYCSRLRLAADGIAGVDKVTFLQTDLSKPHLGLDIETYKELCSDATLIIHSAWPVNFNLSLSSFSLQLEGLVNVFKLSASGRYCPGVFFCSSISSVSSLPDADGLVPETVVNSFDAPLRNGYAESKFLGELLCAAATTRLGVPTTIARIAQLGGPVNTDGLWNPSEWFSSLTISSMSLGAVPASLGSFLGHIDWLPVDIAADAIVEICFPKHADGPTASSDASAERLQVCHFVNPHPTKWELLLPSIVSVLKLQHRVEATILSPEAWLDEVRLDLEGMLTADDVDGAMLAARNPAAKLLEFYRANAFERMVRRGLACDETVKRSTALRSVPGVGRPWLEKWIAGWRSLSSET